MPKIFCCYRRDDSTYQTGRIFDHLAHRFGKEELFRDVDSTPLGRDFRKVLTEQVAGSKVLLAIIGDDWLSASEKPGERRLDDPSDFVRIEIESALRRNMPLIPVLVGRAEMPKPDDLPESMRELAFRNGLAVRADPDFSNDVERLIRGISEALRGDSPPEPVTKPLSDLENTRTFLLKNVLKPGTEADTRPAPRPGEQPAPSRSQLATERARGPGPAQPAPPTPMTPAPDELKPTWRKPLAWSAASVAIAVAGIVLAMVLLRGRGKAVEDSMTDSLREGVRREVEITRRQEPELLKSQPSLDWEDALPPVDYSAFEIVTDERIVDLRKWKPVPPENAGELVCGVSMLRRVNLRKLRPADEIRFEFRTTGTQVFVSCTSHPNGFHVMGQREEGFVGDKRTKVRQMTVDVHDVPVGSEFPVTLLATYWNSLQKDDDLWFGAMGYPNSYKVSLLLVFPDDKPYKDFRLTVAPTRQAKPQEFRDRRIVLAPDSKDWLYWLIPDPERDHVYSLYWSW
jgi:hypothetical protein